MHSCTITIVCMLFITRYKIMIHKGLLEPLVQKVLSLPYSPRGGAGKLRQNEAILVCMYAWGGCMSSSELKKLSLAWRGDEHAMMHNFNPYYGNKTAINYYGNTKYSLSYDKGRRGTFPWYRAVDRVRDYTNSITLSGFEILGKVFNRQEFRGIAVNLKLAA